MDRDLLQSVGWALLALTLSCLLQYLRQQRKSAAARLLFPPNPPGSWPIVGHLPFFASGCPHRSLAYLAHAAPPEGLGPIIGLRLGSKHAAVICNSHLAKEVLHTHDRILANHPHFLCADAIFYGYDSSIAFASYNQRWAMLRKLCTLELFTAKRLQALQSLRYEEVRRLISNLAEVSHAGTQPVVLGGHFSSMLCNLVGCALHSKPLPEVGAQDFSSILKDQEKLISPTIGDLIPWLRFLDLLPKLAMKKIHRQNNKIIETMIFQRRQLLQNRKDDEPLPEDLLQLLLSKEAKNPESTSSEQDELLHIHEIKGTLLDLMSAGIHTTALTLEWAMAELLRNPRCMQKVRAEIDAVVGTGPDCFVSDEKALDLPYLEQVIKEVFRLHPALPLLVPHVASETVKVDKYILPEGTLVFVNVWAIGRDPDVWESPEEFCPERFDGQKEPIDIKGQHYDLIPFGAGKRRCPGLPLAMSVLHVTLANLVREFEWELPNGQRYEELDMSEHRGMTIMRSIPLLAIPKKRFALSAQST